MFNTLSAFFFIVLCKAGWHKWKFICWDSSTVAYPNTGMNKCGDAYFSCDRCGEERKRFHFI